MKNLHWFHLIRGKNFRLLKVIPVIALIGVVWMNAVVLHKGLSGGWTKISQLVNQRDMRLIARLIAENPEECRDMDQKRLSLYIRSQINKDTPRLLGLFDWDKDIWGRSYTIDILADKIIIKSYGPDRIVGTDDDAQFVLPLKTDADQAPAEVEP